MGVVLNVGFLGLTSLIACMLGRLPKFNTTDFSLLLFWLLYTNCVFYSPDFVYGLETSIKLFGFAVCIYLFARFYASMPPYGDRFIYDVAISTSVCVLIIGFLTVQDPASGVGGRLQIGEGTAVAFSQMVDFAGVFALFYFLAADKSQPLRWRLIALLIFVTILFLAILNATRGTVLSIGAAAALYLALITVIGKAGRFPRLFSVVLLTVAAVLFAALFADLRDHELVLAGVARLTMNLTGDNLPVDQSSMARLILLRDAIDLFMRYPLTGAGIGGYAYHTGGGYPHNMFAELLAETGLFVTFIFAAILGHFCYISTRLMRQRRDMTQVAMVVGLFMVAAAHQQVSFALWMAKPLFFAMGAMAGLYYRSTLMPIPQSRRRTLPRPAGAW